MLWALLGSTIPMPFSGKPNKKQLQESDESSSGNKHPHIWFYLCSLLMVPRPHPSFPSYSSSSSSSSSSSFFLLSNYLSLTVLSYFLHTVKSLCLCLSVCSWRRDWSRNFQIVQNNRIPTDFIMLALFCSIQTFFEGL